MSPAPQEVVRDAIQSAAERSSLVPMNHQHPDPASLIGRTVIVRWEIWRGTGSVLVECGEVYTIVRALYALWSRGFSNPLVRLTLDSPDERFAELRYSAKNGAWGSVKDPVNEIYITIRLS
ncbi:MAG: hypothetical protein HYW56_02560 [Candidatus Harrisonbacteria bacterium]|nr:hypothetical protein [Candidatus Harrisonbacteria bacterium]